MSDFTIPKGASIVFEIDCRAVGPHGTNIDFYATPDGLKAIWTNGSCPYGWNDITSDEDTQEASDGHNVSVIPWSCLRRLLPQEPER